MRKRILSLAMAVVMCAGLVGCGGVGGVKKTTEVDSSKTTLHVGLFKGGIGDAWLKNVITKFEEKYADQSFEEGKKGVQVIIGDYNSSTMEGDTLKDLVSTSQNDVFFTEGVFYPYWVNKGYMLDITDMVDEKIDGEDKSIGEKMDADYKNSLTMDGKIYALPYYQANWGFVYNATLFDEKSWYFAKDGSFTNASGDLSEGPDGKAGTYDDGMPATYEDFYKLMDRIVEDNCIPLQWAGASQDYISWLIGEMAADYEGYDNFMMNYTLNGTATLVKTDTVDYDNMTYKTEKVKITDNNGYELARQEGMLHATKFLETIVQNDTWYQANTCLSGSFKQSDAQLAFVKNTSTTEQQPIAIMVDGTWWENEASTAFQETYGTGKTKFDSEMEYKVMPFPKATKDKVGSETITVSPMDCYGFINANTDQADLAKMFLQFCHTGENMKDFTETTGVMKPYTYSVDDSKLTSYAKSYLEMADNTRSLFPISNSKVYVYSPAEFRVARLMTTKYSSDQDGTSNISNALTLTSGSEYQYSTKNIFEGYYNYRKNVQWTAYNNLLK